MAIAGFPVYTVFSVKFFVATALTVSTEFILQVTLGQTIAIAPIQTPDFKLIGPDSRSKDFFFIIMISS